jgi:hypothetical protein
LSIKKRPISADGTKIERRKSPRFPVSVPVEVSWRGRDGTTITQEGVARKVNAKGGFLRMSVYPELGVRVTLANFLSAQTTEARVIASPNAREGVADGVVIELIVPNESFWGIDLQVEKTTVELQNLEKALQGEDVDARVLKEYREAVEYIRTAASAVRQLRESQLRGASEGDLNSLLAAERIRRAINVSLEVITDFDSGQLSPDLKLLSELYHAIEQLNTRLKRIIRSEAALKHELERSGTL